MVPESSVGQSGVPKPLTPRQEIRVMERIAKAYEKLTPAGRRWALAYLNDPKKGTGKR